MNYSKDKVFDDQENEEAKVGDIEEFEDENSDYSWNESEEDEKEEEIDAELLASMINTRYVEATDINCQDPQWHKNNVSLY